MTGMALLVYRKGAPYKSDKAQRIDVKYLRDVMPRWFHLWQAALRMSRVVGPYWGEWKGLKGQKEAKTIKNRQGTKETRKRVKKQPKIKAGSADTARKAVKGQHNEAKDLK
ncbi:hypothetical protein Tco_0210932 [Tanacetum coccineum]